MMLAELRGRFLFEIIPDMFPYDHLTPQEIALWARYYEHKTARMSAR